MSELANRRSKTSARILELKNELAAASSIANGKACVYATGSFGRGEASPHSDLDLFIVGNGTMNGGGEERSLKRLEEIRLKAQLIEVTNKLKIPEFSGDGKYLQHYTVHELTKTLGKSDDDAQNTFTARLLLLLESKPLIEERVYGRAIEEVIGAYWKDYDDYASKFMPAFLANDILRLWRTFCVNYEAGREDEPERKKAKAKTKNYKLKHSRLLTCFSGIAFLLSKYVIAHTVSPRDALQMTKITPTERMEWIATEHQLNGARETIKELMEQYEAFLEATNVPEEELIDRFLDKEQRQKYRTDASKFGNLMFNILEKVGGDTDFYRLLVV